MQLILVLLLAVTLQPDATRVALDREGWPAAKDEASHSTWWWSPSCAPQKLQEDQTKTCGATRNLGVRIFDANGRAVPGAAVRWGSAALLRDLPDDRLPSATATEEGFAQIAAPSSEEIWLRAATPNAATPWTRVPAAAREVRLTAAPALPVRIVLRGEDDLPVVRARVALLPPDCTSLCPGRLFALDEKKKPAAVTATPGTTYRVVVWSDSHAPATRTVTASEADLAITLRAGGAIDARLVDGEGKPVRGTFDAQYRLPELGEAIRRTAAATPDGSVALGGLPPSLVEWSASASAFARRVDQASLTAGSVTSLGDVVLHPARQVSVSVRDQAGRAVGGAKIVARGSSFTTTDGKGSALLRDLPPGEIALQISADGFVAATATIPKAERELAVTLARGAAVKAALLRQSDGQAPQVARVRVTNNGRQTLRTVHLSEGFLLSGLRGGTARLSIQSDGAQPYDTGTLQLVEGEVLDLGVVTLATGFAIRGTIVDDRAAPIGGARIRLLRTDGDSPALAHVLGNWSEVESAEDGTFQLTGLKGGSHLVVIDARGFAQHVLPNVATRDDDTSADVGTVALETGRTVDLVCRPEKRCGTEASMLIAGADYPFLAIRTSLQQGRGTFNAVPSGSATLRLTRNQHVTHERGVSVASGREPATMEIDLPSVRVRGEVVTGSRRAREGSLLFTRSVRSAGVPIMMNGATEHGTTIDKQWLGSFGASSACELASTGEFTIDDLEPGPYDVVFRSNGASTTTVRVEVPDVPEHHLQLRFEGAGIAGKVYDAESRPAAVRVEVIDAAGARHLTSSGLDGEFRLLGLSGGRARVKATGAGKTAATEVETGDAAAHSVVLRLADDPSSGLTVDVRHDDGRPAAGVLVFAMANGGVIAGSTDREGRASLQSVAGGAVAVAVHEPGGKWAFADGRSGDTTRVVLPARPGVVVANCSDAAGDAGITAPNGFPLDRVLAMVGISSRISPASSLRISGLPPGAYGISLGAFRKGVTVAPGAIAEVHFGN